MPPATGAGSKVSSSRPNGWLCALWSLAFTACSALFVKGPPPPEERERIFECTKASAAPGVDVLLATLQIASAVYVATRSDTEMNSARRNLAMGVNVPLAAIFTGSGIWGMTATSACREALGDEDVVRRKSLE